MMSLKNINFSSIFLATKEMLLSIFYFLVKVRLFLADILISLLEFSGVLFYILLISMVILYIEKPIVWDFLVEQFKHNSSFTLSIPTQPPQPPQVLQVLQLPQPAQPEILFFGKVNSYFLAKVAFNTIDYWEFSLLHLK